MVTPKVLSMRELRQGLAEVVDGVVAGGPVFAGPNRRAEVVLMSVRQFEALTVAQEQAVESTAASMQMEGMPLTEGEGAALRELAAGRIDFAEYRRRIGV
jgi:hypothetical protein